jgi:Sec-independent protein secretion pathway component TatC
MTRPERSAASVHFDPIYKALDEIAENERAQTRIWIALSFVLFFAGGAAGYFIRWMVTP